MATLYKITGPNGECVNGGSGTWPLPTAGGPGDWWRIDGRLEACRNGLHLASAVQLPTWHAPGTRTFAVETEGPILDAGGKYVAGAVRLVREVDAGPIIAAVARAETAHHDRCHAAMQRRDRAIRKATDALSIPAGWRAYLARIAGVRVPKDHPAHAYAVAIAAAEAGPVAAYDRAVVRSSARLARETARIPAAAMQDA